MKKELLYGVHPIREALIAGRREFFSLYIAENRKGRAISTIVALAEKKGLVAKKAPASFFQDQAGQHIAMETSPVPPCGMGHILEKAAENSKPGFILVLDGIVDPHNCGALIRTALCAGADGIITTKDRSVPMNPVVSKASAGALEHALVARVVNLARSLKELKQAGYWIFGADARGDKDLWEADFKLPSVLCIGGEEKGLRPLIKKQCDFLLSIPQHGPVSSLNASVAGGVLIYEAMRQRRAAS